MRRHNSGTELGTGLSWSPWATRGRAQSGQFGKGQVIGRKKKGRTKKVKKGVHRGEEKVKAIEEAAVPAIAKDQMLALAAKDRAAVVGLKDRAVVREALVGLVGATDRAAVLGTMAASTAL